MANNNDQKLFIQEAMKSLSQEKFDEVVSIFQKYYLKHDVVNVNGPHDGGCDIKIYKNRKEQKNCVQITIQKKWENKLRNELSKASKLITENGYSNKYEFFYSRIISESNVEKYKKHARDVYDIDLDIYEANRLSQLECPELVNYIYSLHKNVIIKPSQLGIDRTTQSLYNFLSVGKDASNIKNDFLNAFIITILYEKGSMIIETLKSELEKRTNKKFPDIQHTISLLKSAKRIVNDPSKNGFISLSDAEYQKVKDIFDTATLIEHDFYQSFEETALKYSIPDFIEIINKLKEIYRDFYTKDIDGNESYKGTDNNLIFDELQTMIASLVPDEKLQEQFIIDIKQLCEDNTYLNKIAASESFLSLYKSDKLELYINQKQKIIFLDTPALVYLLCATFEIDSSDDWQDPLYRSMKSLHIQQQKDEQRIHFKVLKDYIGEVAGELTKAYKIASLENNSFFKNLGNTTNTFYNYYRYLKDNIVELDETINDFEDFLNCFGINVDCVGADDDRTLIIRIKEIIEDLEIEIVSNPWYDNFTDAKTEYEKKLFSINKNKSNLAISNDTKQILYLLNENVSEYTVLTSWDSTLSILRDTLLKKNENYSYFYIFNPAKLSNKISLENFDIDSSAITNDIFIYADKTFGVFNKVKTLIEIIAPIIGGSKTNDIKVIKAMGEIRKQQIESMEYNEKDLYHKNLPIEDVVVKMIPNKEMQEKDADIMKRFRLFILNDNNVEYIINIINNGVTALLSNKELDLKDFYEKVSNVEL